MRLRYVLIPLIVLVGLCLALVVIYNLPPVHERLALRLANWQGRLERALNPPEQVVFVPLGPGAIQTVAQATLNVMLPTAAVTPTPARTATAVSLTGTTGPTATLPPTATPTPSPTPIPAQVALSGVIHEFQQFNNCGPSNLAMALSYWGWQGDQRDTRSFLRPNPNVDDKNVNPEEMVAYVQQFTALRALTRVGGDLDLLKRLIAAGFPVIIEKGHDPPDDFWMGHYLVVTGYDDQAGRFTAQDSLTQPDQPLPYDELGNHEWRDFNNVYVLIYPPEREAEVFFVLGPRAGAEASYRIASERALQEIPQLQGRDLFFAWFALGSSRVGLQDYAGAAEAYDTAFNLYQALPEEERPYRLMWYQSGPYQAYYYTRRYQDVVNLANTTFTWVSKPVLEESYYWRGMAYEALGTKNQAIADYLKAATLNPNYAPPRQALERLGVALP